MTDNTGYFAFDDDLHIVSIFLGKNKDIYITDLISIFVGYSTYMIGNTSGNAIINQYCYCKVVKSVYDDTSKTYTGFESVTVAYPVEILYI